MNARNAIRVFTYFCLGMMLGAANLHAAQEPRAVHPSAVACSGSGPYPCARTDLKVRQESTPPGWSWNPPVNAVQNDPDFGSPIVRVTNNNTLISPSCFDRPSALNSSLTSPASPEVNVFSSDDRWMRIQDLRGNAWLMSFNPTALQAGCAKSANTRGGYIPLAAGIFGRSKADAGIYFGLESQHIIAKYDVAEYANPANGPVTVMDLSECPGLHFLESLARQSMGWAAAPSLSGDDSRIMYTIGPVQNEGWLSILYDQSTQKCGWVDLRTGKMGGDLWAGGQMSGAFPLNFNENGGPTVPPMSSTVASRGRLIPGHTYKIQYSLVYESDMNGTGESAGSPIQSITVDASHNAILLPSPAASVNDSMTWTHYNIYACDSTAKPGCTPTLQPASNLGCMLSAPFPTATTIGSSGSTTYNYIEEAVGTNCNTWGFASIRSGPNTLSLKNYVKVAAGPVSGANRYRLIAGSWVHGTATADQGYLPGEIYESGSAGSVNDNANEGIKLSAVGTIAAGISSRLNLTTTGGPAAPSVSTLGISLHEQFMSLNGEWVAWRPETMDGSTVFWSLGTPSSEWCNLAAASENPPDSYVSCVGHTVMGYQGAIFNGGERGQVDPHYDENWRPITDSRSLNVPDGSVVRIITHFPATDTVCRAAGYDQHQSWNLNQGLGDLRTPFLVSTDGAGSSTCQSPTYVGRAWAREIYMVDPGTGIVYRIAHHRASGTSHYLSSCSTSPHCESDFYHNSLATISPSGRFAMFTSDMEWHLGCDPTTSATCTYSNNGQVFSGEARADVWIVGLNPASENSSSNARKP
jgi:hypothetical protein